MIQHISPIAEQRPSFRKRRKKMKPFGLAVHTTGKGIVNKALKKGVLPINMALDRYRKKGSVHYTIGYDGTIYQMLADDRYAAHIGVSWLQRRSYLSGAWTKKVNWRSLQLWRARWRGYKSPQHIYPSKTPNGCYVGVELTPLSVPDPCTGLWFTDAQHRAVARLFRDLQRRHGWDNHKARLVTHGDLSPLTRWDNHGSWDIGAMRTIPRFDWDRVRKITDK